MQVKLYLAMYEGGNGKIPRSVGGHAQSKEWPYPVIVEWRYEHRRGTTSTKYVCPRSLIEMIIYVVYVTARNNLKNNMLKAN